MSERFAGDEFGEKVKELTMPASGKVQKVKKDRCLGWETGMGEYLQYRKCVERTACERIGANYC